MPCLTADGRTGIKCSPWCPGLRKRLGAAGTKAVGVEVGSLEGLKPYDHSALLKALWRKPITDVTLDRGNVTAGWGGRSFSGWVDFHARRHDSVPKSPAIGVAFKEEVVMSLTQCGPICDVGGEYILLDLMGEFGVSGIQHRLHYCAFHEAVLRETAEVGNWELLPDGPLRRIFAAASCPLTGGSG